MSIKLTPNGALIQKRLTAQVGKPYVWGPEDCSELFYDVMGPEGFHVVRDRVTADDYFHMGVRIPKPEFVGDYFVELDSPDHAHHIGLFFGPDAAGIRWTVEARGHAYGCVKYRLDDPVNGIAARGGVWMRLKSVHLGGFIAAVVPAPAPKPVPPPKPTPPPAPALLDVWVIAPMDTANAWLNWMVAQARAEKIPVPDSAHTGVGRPKGVWLTVVRAPEPLARQLVVKAQELGLKSGEGVFSGSAFGASILDRLHSL